MSNRRFSLRIICAHCHLRDRSCPCPTFKPAFQNPHPNYRGPSPTEIYSKKHPKSPTKGFPHD